MKISHTDDIKNNKIINRTLKWLYNDKEFELTFPNDISYIYSKEINKIFIEDYENGNIEIFKPDGSLNKKIKIPDLDGYQFRGLNKNKKSKSGISFLFFPIANNVGNEWNDIEQYELLISNKVLGEKLGLFR